MNYKAHTVSGVVAATSCGIGFCITELLSTDESLFFSCGFVFATLFLGPDLDLFHSKVTKNWGILRWLWWPYSRVCKHRGSSHIPLLSSFVRLAYLQLSVLLIILVFGNLWGVILDEAMDIKYTKNLYSHFNYLALGYPRQLGMFVLGIVSSDLLHIVSDFVSSWRKKWQAI